MEDRQAQELLKIAQSRLNEIDSTARATRALVLDEGVAICVKVSDEIWKDRSLIERLSEKIKAIEGVTAVYIDFSTN